MWFTYFVRIKELKSKKSGSISIILHIKITFHPFPFKGIRLKNKLPATETTNEPGITQRNEILG